MAQDDNNIRDIPGYEGIYGATPSGRVFSFRRKKFLKPWLNFYGRPMVNLCVNYEKHWQFISRLVYAAHKGPIPEGLDIDHINGDKTDNNLSNLRPLNRSENMLSYFELRRLTKNR